MLLKQFNLMAQGETGCGQLRVIDGQSGIQDGFDVQRGVDHRRHAENHGRSLQPVHRLLHDAVVAAGQGLLDAGQVLPGAGHEQIVKLELGFVQRQ